MCGILGGNIFKNDMDFEEQQLAIHHRGKDCIDYKKYPYKLQFITKHFYFGHNRLSIQDLSTKSNQPFTSNCGRYLLLYNGELWKSTFDKWNDYLRSKYDFHTEKSDTELLMYFLIHHRKTLTTSINEINGMFSFCFFDSEKETIILGRDFIGRIPLYYYFFINTYRQSVEFGFSSEIKPLAMNKTLRHVINSPIKPLAYGGTLRHYKNFNDVRRRNEYVKTLKGGTLLFFEFDKENQLESKIELKTYYHLKRTFDMKNPNYPKTEDEFKSLEVDKGLDYYVDGFRTLLEKSVDDEMISDVPMATILSGGIDSSIITYLLSKKNPNIECFVVGMETPRTRKDDLYYSQIVADYLGLKLHKVIITKKMVMDYLDVGVGMCESSKWTQVSPTIPQMYLSQKIKKLGYKVVFGGEGADELFASYGDVKRFSWNTPIDYHKRKINMLDKLHSTNLPRTNKAMMFGSVELRTPFLSKELVEFSMKIPTKYRDENEGKGKLMKYILRKSFEKELPKEIINRPKKTFQVGANTDFLKYKKGKIEQLYQKHFKGFNV